VVAAGSVLEVDRHVGLDRLDPLAPPQEPGPGLVVLGDMPAVHDDGPRPDLGGGVAGLLQDLAGGDADLVVRRRQVHEVGRVHVDGGGRGPQGSGVGAGLGLLPALRVTEEDLDDVGILGGGGGERVVGRNMRSDEHAPNLRLRTCAVTPIPR
jgi:hypothetical protein